MSLLNNDSFTVERVDRSTGSWSKGQRVEGTSSTFTARGSVQPITGRELQLVPELDREKENIKIYTETELIDKDVVTRANGLKYQVQAVSDWTPYGIPHYKARATLLDDQG